MGRERIGIWRKIDSNPQDTDGWSSLHLSAAWKGVMGLDNHLSCSSNGALIGKEEEKKSGQKLCCGASVELQLGCRLYTPPHNARKPHLR